MLRQRSGNFSLRSRYSLWQFWPLTLCLAVGFGLATAVGVHGADGPEKPHEVAPAAAAVDAIEGRIKGIKEKKDLDATLREQILDIYGKALERLRSADEFAVKARDFAQRAESAPGDIEKVRAELARLPKQDPTAIPPAAGSFSLAQMQQSLARAESDRDHRRQEVATLNDETERRGDRRKEIAQRDEEVEAELRDVHEALERHEDADGADLTGEAQQALWQAKQKSLAEEQEMQRQELFAFEATAELVTDQRDLAARQLQIADALLDVWQDAVNQRRRSEAEGQLAESQRRDNEVHPTLRPVAEANIELATTRREIALRIEETTADSEATSTRLEELREQFDKVTERAKKVGFTEAIGLLLRKQRDTLPVIDASLRNKRDRAANVSQLSMQLTEFEEQREKLADVRSRVRTQMAELRSRITPAEAPAVEKDLTELLETQRTCLDALIRDTTRYVDELMELETVERQLVACVQEFAAFSDEHILWIRSTGLPQRGDAERLVQSASWLAKPAAWQRAALALGKDVVNQTPAHSLADVLLLGLMVCQTRLVKRLDTISKRGTSQPAPLSATCIELVLAISAAAWLPAVVAFAGVRLVQSRDADEFIQALGRALTAIAIPCFLLGLVRRLIVRSGVAANHFGWDQTLLAGGRWALRTFAWAGIPLAFLVLITEAQFSEGPKNSLGRLAFVLLMGICAWSAQRLWTRAAGLAPRASSDDPELGAPSAKALLWRRRLAGVLRLVFVAGPVLLALGSLAGYHYTAVKLAQRLAASVGFATGLILVHALCTRWMRLSNFGELAADSTPQPASALRARTGPAWADTSEAVGLLEMAASQVRRLVRLGTVVVLVGGMLWIWSGVIPALRMLHSVEVWPQPLRWVDPAMLAEEAGKIVTLAGLLSAVFIAAVTMAAARNLPGMVELTLLRRFTLDAGARYAAAAICRYLIAVAGLFFACSHVGIGWAQLNWLVAAMTVGLGFGLQEIFANFVSGLILLFERPVRIGDIVSVEGVTGTVSRIRIRATTITDGDMRELIVPNKQLITGRVINWTLSNTVARMTILVKTAYSADPDKSRNLLLSIAAQHPLVLKQPAPQALFDEFSDKSLNFTLQVYMANTEVYAQLRHELLTAIQRSFRQAGIPLSSADPIPQSVTISPPEHKAA